MYPAELTHLITQAVNRLEIDMTQAAPFMAGPVAGWLRQLSGTPHPADYFTHPLAFPALLLPWWLAQTLPNPPAPPWQANIAYATINGYYAIRLVDNLMDGHATMEVNLLPALQFFHARFQGTFQPWFEANHPFWDTFYRLWFHSANVTMQDAVLTHLTQADFEQIAAQKIAAAKIPLAATCYHTHHPALLEPWSRLVDRLGCWHQLLNDLMGWHRDDSRGAATYFLSEAERQRRPTETVLAWVARAGLAWAAGLLHTWLADMQTQAANLNCPTLAHYLDTRHRLLQTQLESTQAGLQTLAKLAAAVK